MPLKSHASTSKSNNLLIVIAHSARALAESGNRAGFQVVSVDGFADLDTQESCVECWCIPLVNAEFIESALTVCLQKLYYRYPCARVILGSGAEQFIHQVETLSGWSVSGNSSSCVETVLNPRIFFAGLEALDIPFPTVSIHRPASDLNQWLCKTPYRCGGMGVLRLSADQASPALDHYWQKEIEGRAISALFLCGKREWQMLGVNQQFSASLIDELPYVYCGARANIEIDNELLSKIKSYIHKIVKYFKLIGLCSIDMIQTADGVLVLEVNPRVSATFELYERLQPALNLVDAHVRVCEGERLLEQTSIRGQNAYWILYTDKECRIPEKMNWPDWVSDRPHAGHRLNAGEPLCTLHLDEFEPGQLDSLVKTRKEQLLEQLKQ